MTWAMLYLVCFLVGVSLSVLSVASGGLHLPHIHFHVLHPHGGVLHSGAAGLGASRGTEIPWFNFATLSAFLTWFGGTGFLLSRYSSLMVALILASAIAAGLLASATIFCFVAKLLLSHDQALDPADYERVGVLGHVSSHIAAGGTGEIIFSLAGIRQTCGARAESGEELAQGSEVIITRYEHGIAYVRRWDEMLDGTELAHDENGLGKST
jgi:membrane protein implicated in regulation of membrane protease activity